MENCRDCDMPIEVYGSKKEHLCKQCYIRKTNSKNRGTEYIPFKDLDEKEKSRIINMRKGNQRAAKNKKVEKFKDEELDELIQEKEKLKNIKTIVEKDIENTFKACGLDLDLSQYSIHSVMKMLNTLISNYDKISDKLEFTEKILNGMSTDYSHSKEYHSTQYIMNFDSYSPEERLKAKKEKEFAEEKHNYFMIKRRELMKVITEYKIMSEFFKGLLENKELMETYKSNYSNLERFEEMHANNQYNAEYSDLVAQERFVVGYKNKSCTKCKWKVTVPTYSYESGKRVVGSFNRNNIEAYDEIEAKEKFKEHMNANAYKFTWFESEAKVENLGPVVKAANTPR